MDLSADEDKFYCLNNIKLNTMMTNMMQLIKLFTNQDFKQKALKVLSFLTSKLLN